MSTDADHVAAVEVGLPRPIAFVLSGGGSLGAAQVGMLQALADRDIAPDLIVGTSVGALNGAFLAADPVGGANRLSHVWPSITKELIFPGSAWRSVRTLRSSRTHLYESTALADFIREHLDVTEITGLSVPFAAMATDVDTMAPVAMDSGALGSALLASAAIPGIFPAVEREGRLLLDGGLVANLPIRQALHMGAASLVLLDCAFPGRQRQRPETYLHLIEWSISTMMYSQSVADLPFIAEHVPVLYLPGPERVAISPLDFELTVELMGGAYDASRSFLETLRMDGPGLYQVAGGAYEQLAGPPEPLGPEI